MDTPLPGATRAQRPGDAAAIRAVLSAAFGTDAEAGLVDALRNSAAWLPGLSMVAEEDPWSGLGDAWQMLALTGVEAHYPTPWHAL